jgi:hypothetical protein
VKEGIITSSPGVKSQRSAAISSAAVHEFVIKARLQSISLCICSSHAFVSGPLPDRLLLLNTSVTDGKVHGETYGWLKYTLLNCTH